MRVVSSSLVPLDRRTRFVMPAATQLSALPQTLLRVCERLPDLSACLVTVEHGMVTWRTADGARVLLLAVEDVATLQRLGPSKRLD